MAQLVPSKVLAESPCGQAMRRAWKAFLAGKPGPNPEEWAAKEREGKYPLNSKGLLAFLKEHARETQVAYSHAAVWRAWEEHSARAELFAKDSVQRSDTRS